MELNQSQVVIEERKEIKSGESSQFILTLYFIISTYRIKENLNSIENLDWSGKILFDFLFYGNLIWMIYLVFMLISKYKDKKIRKFFGFIDVLIYFFYLLIWTWMLNMYYNDDLLGKYDKGVDLFCKVYLILGLIGFSIIFVAIFGLFFKLISSSREENNGYILDNQYLSNN